MSYDESSAEAEAGRRGEAIVDRYCRSLGWGIVRLSDISGGAALLERDGDTLILPDRQILAEGVLRWVEIKWKSAPVIYQKSGTLGHGIDLPNWLHHLKLLDEAKLEVAIAIVQVKEHRASSVIAPKFLFQTVRWLRTSVANVLEEPTADFPRGAVFWDVDVFQDLGSINDFELEAPLPATRLNLRPWERPAKDGSLPGPRTRKTPAGEASNA